MHPKPRLPTYDDGCACLSTSSSSSLLTSSSLMYRRRCCLQASPLLSSSSSSLIAAFGMIIGQIGVTWGCLPQWSGDARSGLELAESGEHIADAATLDATTARAGGPVGALGLGSGKHRGFNYECVIDMSFVVAVRCCSRRRRCCCYRRCVRWMHIHDDIALFMTHTYIAETPHTYNSNRRRHKQNTNLRLCWTLAHYCMLIDRQWHLN